VIKITDKLEKAINIALKSSLEIKKDEKVLIITNNEMVELAEPFFFESRKITKNTKMMKMKGLTYNGQEPPHEIAEEMKHNDVILILTTKSLSHTKARLEASNSGARIASMPTITKEIIERSLDVDYNKMKDLSNKLADILDKGNNVKITTEKGTNLEFSIKDRNGGGRKSGIYNKPGYWGNLPSGEAFIAPVEGTTNGKMIIDGSIAGIGKVEDTEITIKDGLAINTTNNELNKTLETIGEKSRNIAELGIGTNEKAIITGCVLEDEKVLGTCHIALGNNMGFGGKTDVEYHADCVFDKPTIEIDEKTIMEKGKLLI